MAELYGTPLLLVGAGNAPTLGAREEADGFLEVHLPGPSCAGCAPLRKQKRNVLVPRICRIKGDCGLASKHRLIFLFRTQ